MKKLVLPQERVVSFFSFVIFICSSCKEHSSTIIFLLICSTGFSQFQCQYQILADMRLLMPSLTLRTEHLNHKLL